MDQRFIFFKILTAATCFIGGEYVPRWVQWSALSKLSLFTFLAIQRAVLEHLSHSGTTYTCYNDYVIYVCPKVLLKY